MLPEKYQSRKLILALIVLMVAILALFTKHLSGDQFIDVAKWVVGLYGLANVGNKVATRGAGNAFQD